MAPNLYRIRAESGDGDVDHREAGLFDCSTQYIPYLRYRPPPTAALS
jgi:hypothetical protein